jgi:hypothetical protein
MEKGVCYYTGQKFAGAQTTLAEPHIFKLGRFGTNMQIISCPSEAE